MQIGFLTLVARSQCAVGKGLCQRLGIAALAEARGNDKDYFTHDIPPKWFYSLLWYRKKQASYDACFFGAGNETRTRYLHLGKVALYRMSYARTRNILYVTTQIRFVKQNFHVPDKFI